jgi:hypothetical protein
MIRFWIVTLFFVYEKTEKNGEQCNQCIYWSLDNFFADGSVKNDIKLRKPYSYNNDKAYIFWWHLFWLNHSYSNNRIIVTMFGFGKSDRVT